MAGEKFIALEETSQEIKTAVEGISNSLNENLEQNLGLINSTIGTDNPVSLDTIILQAVYGNVFEYTNPGTYTLLIPANVNKIKVTACGGGGAGGGDVYNASSSRAGGGGGGAAIVDQEYDVTPQSQLSITVGSGGKGSVGTKNTYANSGTATIIGNLVTLAGGQGGYQSDTAGVDTGGAAGGVGGGKGGNAAITKGTAGKSTSGTAGVLGAGGAGGFCSNAKYYAGGGGGGSLGAGGIGGLTNGVNVAGTAGTKGGGGGGAGTRGYNQAGSSGGNGYVKIELIITA